MYGGVEAKRDSDKQSDRETETQCDDERQRE